MLGLQLGLGLNSRGGNNIFNFQYDFFANTLPTGMVFSRASVATDLVNGVLTDYAIDAPRVSSYNGFLNEQSKTNSIRNGEATGAVVGTIGGSGSYPTNWNAANTTGLAVDVVASGTVNGFKYTDIRLYGTAAVGTYSLLFDSATQIAAASGNVWTGSVWVGLLSGALTNITSTAVRVSERAAGAELDGTSTTFTPTIDPTRFMSQRVFNNAGTTHCIHQIDVITGVGAVDVTLRIAAPQFETGYDLTSYIRTTGAAATRAVDIAYIPSNVIGYNTNEGTFVVAYNLGNSYSGSTPRCVFGACSKEDNKNSVRLLKLAGSAFHEAQSTLNYGLPASIVFGSVAGVYSSNIVAFRYKPDDAAVSRNGSAVSKDTSFPTMPTGIDTYRVYLGQQSSSVSINNLNGYITGFKYSRIALSDTQLISETA